jgi:hypothetical protein
MHNENMEVSKEARRQQILEELHQIDEYHKQPHAKFSDPERTKRLERELAELDGIPFSD